MTPDAEAALEREHQIKIIHAFNNYSRLMQGKLQKHYRDYENLSSHHQSLVQSFRENLDRISKLIEENQKFFSLVIKDYKSIIDEDDNDNDNKDKKNECKDEDRNKDKQTCYPRYSEKDLDFLSCSLRQLIRDWSAEGHSERLQSYGPIIDILKTHFTGFKRSQLQVLVPGAGLGRLAYEIAKLGTRIKFKSMLSSSLLLSFLIHVGFNCQGNEFSLYMLFISEYMLNKCRDPIAIYPFLLPLSNSLGFDNNQKAYMIPDHAIELDGNISFSMTAGDFEQVYADDHEKWHVIVTCFFIDTAKNIIKYLEIIYNLLIPGGIWINHGPLLYHFEDSFSEPSLELPLDQIRDLIVTMGFSIELDTMTQCSYAQNPHSMYQTIYNSSLMKMIKAK